MSRDGEPVPGSSSAVTPGSHVSAWEVGDERILLDERTGRLHLLDRIGALIWQCLDGVTPDP